MNASRTARALLAALLWIAASGASVGATLGSVEISTAAGRTRLHLRTVDGAVRARPANASDLWRIEVDAAGVHVLAEDSAPTAAACGVAIWAALAPATGDDAGVLYLAATIDTGAAAHSLLAAVRIDRSGTPRLVWVQDQRGLPGLGLLAAAPTPVWLGPEARPALALGSGWPATGDAPAALALDPAWPATAEAARQPGVLLLLDASTGAPLWPAWSTAAALPGGISAVDIDADGSTDRLYLADAGAQVWRLDLQAGATGTGVPTLVAQRLAQLATTLAPGAVLLHAPDVALGRSSAGAWLELSFASSNRPGARASRHVLVRVRDESVDPPQQRDARIQRVDLPGPATGPPLTIAGETHVAVATGPARCAGTVAEMPDSSEVLTLRPRARVATDAVSASASAQFDVSRTSVTAEPGASLQLEWLTVPDAQPQPRCVVGSEPVAPCRFGPTLTHDYWLRRDAP